MDFAIEMNNITKYFNGVVALKNVNLSVKKGEIHCLLGENGAGKTTLMNILFGLYEANEGNIKINNKKVSIKNTRMAFKLGLGMVHQHFMLIDNMTVLQNIILGNEIGNYKINYLENKNAVQKVIDRYGLDIDLNKKVKELSVGMKQRVEIIKTLYRGADILVLDEPSAVLTPKESKVLMNILKGLKNDGKTIIFITHKLYETIEIADRATILRAGNFIETVDIKNVNADDLAIKMVGHSIPKIIDRISNENKEKIFEIKNLKLLDNSTKNINLSINRGEILGIAGVDGNGQLELEEMIMGLRSVEEGDLLYNGNSIINNNTLFRKNLGIGHIPSDRIQRAILPNMSIYENILLGNQESIEFSKKLFIDYRKLKDHSINILKKFNVRFSDIYQNIKSLSGGNQQKVVVSRELNEKNSFILASQPSRGLDIGAIQFIHDKFVEIRNKNKSVLLISADLDEILEMSDKIAVLYKGEIMAIDKKENFTKEKLGLLMAGKRDTYEKEKF